MDFLIKEYTKGTFLSLLKAALSAVKTASTTLYNKVDDIQYGLKFNGQKIYIQRYLNDLFDNTSRRIWIRVNDRIHIKYKFRAGEATVNYKYRFEEIDGVLYGEELFEQDFDSGDMAGPLFECTHSLNTWLPVIVIYDNNSKILAGSNYSVTVDTADKIVVDMFRTIPGTYHIRVTNDYFVHAGTIGTTPQSVYKYRASERILYGQNHFDVMYPTGLGHDATAMDNAVKKLIFPWLKFSQIAY